MCMQIFSQSSISVTPMYNLKLRLKCNSSILLLSKDLRQTAVAQTVDIEEIEKGIQHSIALVQVKLQYLFLTAHYMTYNSRILCFVDMLCICIFV